MLVGCRGVTRSDFRYDAGKRDLVLLEINTQPGMTPVSLVPEMAAIAALALPTLCNGLWRMPHASDKTENRD